MAGRPGFGNGRTGLTLDELLADLDREVAGTWAPEEAFAHLPGETAAAPPPAAGERCLLVSVAGRRFAVPTHSVLAVSELPPVSAVPFSPPWLRGLARAAGGVAAIVDLARLLSPGAGPWPDAPAGAAAAGDTNAVRETLLVVRTSDGSLEAGLAVSGIARLVTLAGVSARAPAAGELDAGSAALVAGLAPDPHDARLGPVAVLDVDRLLRGARDELRA
jgi:chemotaxis signal transduction protein